MWSVQTTFLNILLLNNMNYIIKYIFYSLPFFVVVVFLFYLKTGFLGSLLRGKTKKKKKYMTP